MIPQKKELEKARQESIVEDCYDDFPCDEAYLEGAVKGFNRCIDTILKEVFENPVPYNGDNIGSRD